MKHLKQNMFIYGLVASIVLALSVSQLDTLNNGEWIVSAQPFKWWLIALIFFFQGLGLPRYAFKDYSISLNICLAVLFWNYIGAILCAYFIFMPTLQPNAVLGFFFLTMAPSTIALSVSYTDLSGGDVSQALVSTCISNFLGTFILPVSFILVYRMGEGSVDLSRIGILIERVLLCLFIPLFLGYGLRYYGPKIFQKLLIWKKYIIEGLLLILIFNAFLTCFCQTFIGEEFMISGIEFIRIISYSLGLFMIVSYLVWQNGRCLKLQRGRQIAFFFTASQKSICSGIPLILLTIDTFGFEIETGFILLPLVSYYFYQTLFGAWIVRILCK